MLRAVFESSRDAIGVAKNGVHQFANPAYLKLFGFKSNDEVVGRSILISIAPGSHAQMKENVRLRTKGKPAPEFYETRGRSSDGREFDMELSIEEFRILAPTRKFTFNEPHEVIELNLDPVRVSQVISNILDNAVKYTSGDLPIEASIQNRATGIRVLIKDHGKGISLEKQKNLFEAFHRGISDRDVQTSGLGLGLFVCRGIIELHGGTIGLLSDDQGSTFYFELPKEGFS